MKRRIILVALALAGLAAIVPVAHAQTGLVECSPAYPQSTFDSVTHGVSCRTARTVERVFYRNDVLDMRSFRAAGLKWTAARKTWLPLFGGIRCDDVTQSCVQLSRVHSNARMWLIVSPGG